MDGDIDTLRYGAHAPVPTKLDPYKPIIAARWTAGYAGGYSQLKAFVQAVRPTQAPEPFLRFETQAGRQAQVDFDRFRLPWGVRHA